VHVSYHVPQALDLAGEGGREVGARTAAAGLAALPRMAEILPLGGEPTWYYQLARVPVA
jgi:hypothetical protein